MTELIGAILAVAAAWMAAVAAYIVVTALENRP